MPSQLEIDNIVAASGLRLSNPTVPTSAVDTGSQGDISWDGDYFYVCTSDNTWKRSTITSWGFNIEYMVVAGGGGGGRRLAGGGGAGGYLAGIIAAFSNTNYTVTIGAGGAGATSDSVAGSNGSDSVFASITSNGGGGGGSAYDASGKNGGSGGGSRAGDGNPGTGNTPATTPPQGNDGGDGDTTNPWIGGGGGGASSAGTDGTSGGHGGNGTANSITGSSVTYAGGGGGAGYASTNGPAGSGGSGGGGDGSDTWTGTSISSKGDDGSVNTGGGGGGGTQQQLSPYPGANGGSGGAGIVILKFTDTFYIFIGSGLTYTSTTSGGYTIVQFTAGTDTVYFSKDQYFSSVSLLLQDSLTDESPNGYTISTLGSTSLTSTTVKVGSQSFDFSGSSPRGISFGLTTSDWKWLHDKTSSYTIEAWIYPTSLSGRRILLCSDAASASSGVLLELNSGVLRYNIYRGVSGSFTNIYSPSALPINQWSHIAVTIDGTDILLFVDGDLVASTTWSLAGSASNSQQPVTIGYADPNFVNGYEFLGYLDAIRISKTARYTTAFTPPTTAFPA